MHEILILYILLDGQNTMYGIAKTLSKGFAHITNPSYGTLQPALKRLEKKECVSSSSFYTDGGKPYIYYSITSKGKDFLKVKLKSKLPQNPVQLIPELKIKLMCSDILSEEEKSDLLKNIKTDILKLATTTENMLNSERYAKKPQARLVLDNTVCEYKNLSDLTERLLKCRQ